MLAVFAGSIEYFQGALLTIEIEIPPLPPKRSSRPHHRIRAMQAEQAPAAAAWMTFPIAPARAFNESFELIAAMPSRASEFCRGFHDSQFASNETV